MRLKQTAAIALGSNLDSSAGDRAANLDNAVGELRRLGTIVSVSKFFDTAPVGYLDQPRFLNAAALLETRHGALDLLGYLLDIEQAMGRDRTKTVVKGPRVIDLDLILHGDLTMQTDVLTLPHPAMRERRFVLEPLAEIAPDLIDPITGKTIAELLNELS